MKGENVYSLADRVKGIKLDQCSDGPSSAAHLLWLPYSPKDSNSCRPSEGLRLCPEAREPRLTGLSGRGREWAWAGVFHSRGVRNASSLFLPFRCMCIYGVCARMCMCMHRVGTHACAQRPEEDTGCFSLYLSALSA